MLCCTAYIYSSAGYKMSRQPTKNIDHRGSQRDIERPDFAAKMQKCKTEVLHELLYPYFYTVHFKNIWSKTKIFLTDSKPD